MNRIYNTDNIIGMQKLIDDNQEVDLVLTDPPYVISRENKFHTMKDRVKPRTGIEFGAWDEEFDNQPWIEKSFEILRPGGSLVVFNDFKKISFRVMGFIPVSFLADLSKSFGLLEYLKVPEALLLLFLVSVERESRLNIFAPN